MKVWRRLLLFPLDTLTQKRMVLYNVGIGNFVFVNSKNFEDDIFKIVTFQRFKP